MPFEKFSPTPNQSHGPRVTIRPSGLISFDAHAVERFELDRRTHALLFFDKAKKLIGVKPVAQSEDEAAFRLIRRRRTRGIKAPQFFEHFGLSLEAPARFDARFDEGEGMIVIDVRPLKLKRGRRPQPGSGRRSTAGRPR